MDTDWRALLPAESRQKIVRKIMETLQQYFPVSRNLSEVATSFEEQIFSRASDRQDYFRRIALKMSSFEPKNNLLASANQSVSNSQMNNSSSSMTAITAADQMNRAQTTLGMPHTQSQTSIVQSQQAPMQQQNILQQQQQNMQAQQTIQPSSNQMSSLLPNQVASAAVRFSNINPSPNLMQNEPILPLNMQTMDSGNANMLTNAKIQLQAQQQQRQRFQQQQQQQQIQTPQRPLQLTPQEQQKFLVQRQQQQRIQQQQQIALQQQQQSVVSEQLNPTLQQQQKGMLPKQMMTQKQSLSQNVPQPQNLIGQNALASQQRIQQQQIQQMAQKQIQQQQLQAQSQNQSQSQQSLQHQQLQSSLSQNQQTQAPLTSAATTSNDPVWNKLQMLKEKYLNDMKDIHGILAYKYQQSMPPEQLAKVKYYKDMLFKMIPYLNVPREMVPPQFTIEKVELFEKQICQIMEMFRRKKDSNKQSSTSQTIQTTQAPPKTPPPPTPIPAQLSSVHPQQSSKPLQSQMQNQLQSIQLQNQIPKPDAKTNLLGSGMMADMPTGAAKPMQSLNLQQKQLQLQQQQQQQQKLQQLVKMETNQRDDLRQSMSSNLLPVKQEQDSIPKPQEGEPVIVHQNQQSILKQQQKQQQMQQIQPNLFIESKPLNKSEMKFDSTIKPTSSQSIRMIAENLSKANSPRLSSHQRPAPSPQTREQASPDSVQHPSSSSTYKPSILRSSAFPPPSAYQTHPSPLILEPESKTPANLTPVITPGISNASLPMDLPHSTSVAVTMPEQDIMLSKDDSNPLQLLAKRGMSMRLENPKRLKLTIDCMRSLLSCHDRMASSAWINGARGIMSEDLSSTTRSRLMDEQYETDENQDNISIKSKPLIIQSTPKHLVKRSQPLSDEIDDLFSLMESFDHALDKCGHDLDEYECVDKMTAMMLEKGFSEAQCILLKKEIVESNELLVDTFIKLDLEKKLRNGEGEGEGEEEEEEDGNYENEDEEENFEYNQSMSSFDAIQVTLLCETPMIKFPQLKLLITVSYPKTSPLIMEDEFSPIWRETLFQDALSSFKATVCKESSPLSLSSMAKSWDECTRSSLILFSMKNGACVSSLLGTWQSIVPVDS